ncbi:integrase [Siminovitchia sp. FSL W7-1587]|uniref:integrase n=1 Tax=Siminovitchia sp. FSL W7-1587 TaxID=2954699 RepID=UPI0030D21343
MMIGTIKKLIEDTLFAVGMDVEIKHEQCGINMSYNFILHYIGFDANRIQVALRDTKPAVTLEQYVKAFTLHELGHALDRDALFGSLTRTMEIYEMKRGYLKEERYSNPELLALLLEEHAMNLEFEETAWNNAKKLNRMYRIVEWNVFEQIKRHGLMTYQQAYQKDVNIYEQLLSAQSDIA